jgi:hypothetical protein
MAFCEFKWTEMASKYHKQNSFIHFAFIGVLVWYTNYVYITNSLEG